MTTSSFVDTSVYDHLSCDFSLWSVGRREILKTNPICDKRVLPITDGCMRHSDNKVFTPKAFFKEIRMVGWSAPDWGTSVTDWCTTSRLTRRGHPPRWHFRLKEINQYSKMAEISLISGTLTRLYFQWKQNFSAIWIIFAGGTFVWGGTLSGHTVSQAPFYSSLKRPAIWAKIFRNNPKFRTSDNI